MFFNRHQKLAMCLRICKTLFYSNDRSFLVSIYIFLFSHLLFETFRTCSHCCWPDTELAVHIYTKCNSAERLAALPQSPCPFICLEYLFISLRGSRGMRWKINQSELCVHSALSGEKGSNSGLTQSEAANACIWRSQGHKLGRKLQEDFLLIYKSIPFIHASVATQGYFRICKYIYVFKKCTLAFVFYYCQI